MPQLEEAANGTGSSTLQTLSEALADLNMDIHRTIPDPAAIVNSLATTRFCSKQVLKRFASHFKPAASKIAFVCQPIELNNCEKLSIQDLLDSMPSHSNFDGCFAIELETPSMPLTSLQVYQLASASCCSLLACLIASLISLRDIIRKVYFTLYVKAAPNQSGRSYRLRLQGFSNMRQGLLDNLDLQAMPVLARDITKVSHVSLPDASLSEFAHMCLTFAQGSEAEFHPESKRHLCMNQDTSFCTCCQSRSHGLALVLIQGVVDAMQELEQAGIQPMAQSGRQSGLSTTAAQPASPPSVLKELIGGDSSTIHMWEASQLPQPIMLDIVIRRLDLLGALVPWNTLTADFSTALDTNQEHAAAASVPALQDDSQGELWLSVMASHLLSASCAAADARQGAVDDDHISSNSKNCQQVKAEILSSVARSMEECRAQVETGPPKLEVPMLCFKISKQGLMTEVFQAEQCPKAPEYEPASVADCGVKGSSKLTYHSLVAQELTLQESFYTLPVVLFDDSNDYGLDEAQSKEDMWQQCMAECRFRHLKTGHLDLYMDWSLVDKTCPCSASLQTFRRQLKLPSQPDSLPPAAADSALSDSAIAASVISSIAEGACVVPEILYHAVQQPEQLPHAIKQWLCKQSAHQHQAKSLRQAATAVSSQTAADTINLAPSNHISLHAASRAAADDMPLAQQPTQTKPVSQAAHSESKARASGGVQPTGVFQQRSKSAKKAVAATAPQAASAGNDMAFFLGLQQIATAPASGGAAPLPNQAHPIDLCSDGDGEAEEEVAMQLPDVQYVCLQLPEQHARLLNIMQGDQRALLRETDGIDAEVCDMFQAQLLCSAPPL